MLDDDLGLAGHLGVVGDEVGIVRSADGWLGVGHREGLIRILSHRDIGGSTAIMILLDHRINLWLLVSLVLGIFA